MSFIFASPSQADPSRADSSQADSAQAHPHKGVPPTPRQPIKSPREKEADGFHAALAGVLSRGLVDALMIGDHTKAVSFINRGFAEGTPQLGCDLLCQAIAVVGSSRTWTVQIAPLSQVGRTAIAAECPIPETTPGS